MWCGTLAEVTIKGTMRQGGQAYGEEFAEGMLGFLQTLGPDKARLAYAARCWRHIEEDAPLSAEFMQGMAEGSHLPLDHVTLLTLHEEIGHMAHCTAFVASGAATRGGQTINGQNWDFPPGCYPWVSLLRLQLAGTPRTITYQFPGLWACAGINEAGLSLMWTSTGITPLVTAEVGVPTYVLVAEVLRRETVAEAIAYLECVKLAGAFDFLLGDASGAIAVIETLPGYVWVDRSGDAMCRANHYAGSEAARLAQQVLPADGQKPNGSSARCARMAELLQHHYGTWDAATARAVLTERHGERPWLHQYPEQHDGSWDSGSMTLDSFYAVSEERAFHVCRGGFRPGAWQELSL
jgi:hypothetical protein